MVIAHIIDTRRSRLSVIDRNAIDKARYDTGDVIDMGKIAAHFAVIEKLDRPAFDDRLGEHENRHVRASPRPVNGKKPQTGDRQAIKMAIGVGHQFVGLFCRGIKTDGMIGLVVDRKRQLGVGAVNRRRRRIDQMAASVVPASFQNVDKTLEVGVGVSMGMIDRVTHSSLCGEVNHRCKTMLSEQLRDRGTIRQISPNEIEMRILAQEIKPRLLQCGIIIIVETVQTENGMALRQQLTGNVKADETRRTRYQYCLIRHRNLRGRRPGTATAGKTCLAALLRGPQYPLMRLLPDRL